MLAPCDPTGNAPVFPERVLINIAGISLSAIKSEVTRGDRKVATYLSRLTAFGSGCSRFRFFAAAVDVDEPATARRILRPTASAQLGLLLEVGCAWLEERPIERQWDGE